MQGGIFSAPTVDDGHEMKFRPDDEKHFTLHNPLYIIDYKKITGVKSLFDTSHTLHVLIVCIPNIYKLL